MTLQKEQMLADLAPLEPEKKIEVHLDVLEAALAVFVDIVGNTEPFQELIDDLSFCIETGRNWLAEKISDPDEVLRPVEGPGSPFLTGIVAGHENSPHYPDVSVLSVLGHNAIWYAAQIQFGRVGDTGVPQSLEMEFTDEELADLLAKYANEASPRMKQTVDQAWEQSFRRGLADKT